MCTLDALRRLVLALSPRMHSVSKHTSMLLDPVWDADHELVLVIILDIGQKTQERPNAQRVPS